ncbi:LLM class flavin-dependent oxidoreductase [Kineococcus rubinsiae]|uniref:LLM class flavin-dependent oxidoreductase n=1 Tax=Kineococcus rubinsiae TaxID=2609562 RepID=UPI001432185B|nr:LLM class flavin-dependent oxidoreductase [Kineococcus rubinsiae]NIZ89686.1 LLM class flavin-dependent oxidoreductase [Kineococcus rubinsiae]
MSRTATPLSLGLAFVPDLPPERLRALVTTAELAGLDEFWVWEDCFKESGIATAAAALAWTDRIAVGIGLLPVPLRNVALTAMEIATLERLFPGRLRAGVGHGVQDWMQQVGARAASPMTLLEEHARALRALLAGERVTTAGRYVTLNDVALDWPPSTPPPLLVGGTGPKSLALAGRLGDGTLLATAMTEEDVRSSCETVFAARDGVRHPVVVTVIVATGPGARERVDREVPRWGRRADEGIGLAGDAEEIAAGLQRLAELGITSVVAQPTRDEPDLDGLVHLLGREVRPLL